MFLQIQKHFHHIDMIERSIGYQHLIEKFDLNVCELFVKSYLTAESQKKIIRKDDFVAISYPKSRMAIEDTWKCDILFALKYEGINLEVLKAFFKKLEAGEMMAFVSDHPTGARHRRIWMLYEKLSGNKLELPDVRVGNYVNLVDGAKQWALPGNDGRRERRYRVNNNLIGNFQFSPFVRIADIRTDMCGERLKENSDKLLEKYPSELIYRAVQYMFLKETRSSFAIERETPNQKRMESFLSVLREMPDGDISESLLAYIQNCIVDERYMQKTWRTDQVYVGETMTPGHEKVHCIGVRPKDLSSLMDDFLLVANTLLDGRSVDPVLLAAVVSFAFVFIHPFDDGNGRLHRFLMHTVLSRLGFTPKGFIFPISAVLLKKAAEYDRMLESFSRRLMKVINYDISDNGEVEVLGESVDFYRYIDYTPIVNRFQLMMAETITTEWKAELDYLKAYDEMRKGMRDIVDMPDKKANQFILFVRNNNGTLSKAKREYFGELTDGEVHALETVINTAVKELSEK